MKNPFTIKLQASVLLAGQIILLLTSALWDDLNPEVRWPAWIYIILFSAGGYALAGSRRWLVTYILVSMCALLLAGRQESPLAVSISTLCFAIAYSMLFYVLLSHCFFRHKIAAADRIVGGIAGYILLGFLWNSQAQWARLLNEDAFFNVNRDAPTSDSEQLYYSFVTLTGLGYGDVVPTTSVAHLIAMLNVLSGVLYLAIFISALMGGLVEKKKK